MPSLKLAKKSFFLYTGRMEKSRRELNKINCRRRILKASRKLFSAKGYDNTMMEDIAWKAEVSKATVYNYFPNKESLLIGTVDEVLDRVRDLIRNDLAGCESGEKMLRRVLEEFVQASVDYIGLSRRITYLNACEDSELFATHAATNDIFRQLIEKAQAEGVFRADADAGEMVDVVMGVYLIAQFQWPHADGYPPELLRERLNRYFSAMMHAYYVR